MRNLLSTTRISIIAGSALFVAACGGGETAVNEGAANDLESNLMLDAPGNDASAMESMTNVVEPLPTANVGETNAVDPAAGETSTGDTVESNVSGM